MNASRHCRQTDESVSSTDILKLQSHSCEKFKETIRYRLGSGYQPRETAEHPDINRRNIRSPQTSPSQRVCISSKTQRSTSHLRHSCFIRHARMLCRRHDNPDWIPDAALSPNPLRSGHGRLESDYKCNLSQSKPPRSCPASNLPHSFFLLAGKATRPLCHHSAFASLPALTPSYTFHTSDPSVPVQSDAGRLRSKHYRVGGSSCSCLLSVVAAGYGPSCSP